MENSSDSNFDPDFMHYKLNLENTIANELKNNLHHQDNHPNSPFNENELYNVMLNCKSKSPGPDDIPYSFIQNFPLNGKIQLLKIYNAIWNSCVSPDQ